MRKRPSLTRNEDDRPWIVIFIFMIFVLISLIIAALIAVVILCGGSC